MTYGDDVCVVVYSIVITQITAENNIRKKGHKLFRPKPKYLNLAGAEYCLINATYGHETPPPKQLIHVFF